MVWLYEPDFISEKDDDNGLHMLKADSFKSGERVCAEIGIFSTHFKVEHEPGKSKVDLRSNLTISEARLLAARLLEAADEVEKRYQKHGG